MSWYRAGSVTVAAGSNVVTGAGTDFVASTSIGDAWIGQDGRTYEVGQVVSATELRLTTPYQGAGGGGQAYAIQPTQSFARDLALAAAALLNTFAAVRDGVGQGMFPGGSLAAPGIRFTADQDTGIARYGENLLSAVTGGVERMRFGEVNSSLAPLVAGGGIICQQGGVAGSLVFPLDILGALGGAATMRIRFGSSANVYTNHSFIEAQTLTGTASDLRFGTSGVEQARIDNAGNFLFGVASGGNHRIVKSVGEGITVLSIGGASSEFIYFNSVTTQGWSNASTAMSVGRHSGNGRSINAGGTINASGADYAEYMVKAAGCGIIAKGDVCGVDRDGKLTTAWADAVSFVVKSTDPSYVGGDTWAAHLPPRPQAPGAEPVAPIKPGSAPVAPVEPGPEPTGEGPIYVAWLQSRFAFGIAERDYAVALAEWQAATDAYPTARASYEADHAAWVAATAAYARDLPTWEAQLEAARVCVDRIAFCGQVPCNVTGDFEVGDYIVAAQDGDGIKAIAVKAGAITLPQYMARIGKVWAIRDGRAWIDVQHG
ncbi:hypothetical protein [Sphingomonas sanguinis]|uniref:Peptidase S74 domain-containing protein n=1 Tax=Sphingomonas sanguinis TaxID=33051 RepID=A0A147IXF3_9SPHN|nr:hypothetical protein [Sphingomonas sanguinis]KTW00455.1 hypothetical protein SB4_07030 [Sphingomonas sanguinis]